MAYTIKDSSHFNTDNLLFDEIIIKMNGGIDQNGEQLYGTGIKGTYCPAYESLSNEFNGVCVRQPYSNYNQYIIELDNNNNPINVYYNGD